MKKQLPVSKSAVMKKAWGIFRRYVGGMKELSFGECLKMAWKEVKAKSVEFIGHVVLRINGIICEVNTFNGYVTGNTFKAKETLKQYGLKYNGYERLWEGEFTEIQELCRDYAF